MAFDIGALVPPMLAAARGELEDVWTEAKDFAETEFRKTAETIALIERLHLEGTISEERAKLHLQFQKNSAQTVLLTIEGLGIIAAERAINAALGAVRDTVNTALGFGLL